MVSFLSVPVFVLDVAVQPTINSDIIANKNVLVLRNDLENKFFI